MRKSDLTTEPRVQDRKEHSFLRIRQELDQSIKIACLMSQQTALKIDIKCSCTIGHCQGMMAGPYWQRPILPKCTPAFPRTGAVWSGYKMSFEQTGG